MSDNIIDPDMSAELSAELTTAIGTLAAAWDAVHALVLAHGDNHAALRLFARGLVDITGDAERTYAVAAEHAEGLAYRGGPFGALGHAYAPATGQPDAVAHAARLAAENLRSASRHASAQSWALDIAASTLAPLWSADAVPPTPPAE